MLSADPSKPINRHRLNHTEFRLMLIINQTIERQIVLGQDIPTWSSL